VKRRLAKGVHRNGQPEASMKIARVHQTAAFLTLMFVGTHAAAGQTSNAPPAVARQTLPSRAGDADRFTLRTEVNLVIVDATVRDQDGSIVDNLAPQDFHLYEDGVEQRITYFSRDELPLAVALVLDRSGSMGPVLRRLYHVAYETLSLLKPDDQVALFDFAARAERIQDLTTDRRRIAERIATIHAGGATVIPDALYESAAYLAAEAQNRRHAIILVSDNENTLQGYSAEGRVIREALESEAAIYSIRVERGSHAHMMNVLLPIFQDVSVEKMTRETGGEVIEAENTNALRRAMIAAISRLRQRYSLGYYSPNAGRAGAFRRIEIRVDAARNDPKRKYSVYARQGYYVRVEHSTSRNTQP